MIKRWLITALVAGFGFWVYNNGTSGLWEKGDFTNLADCKTAAAWVQAQQPTPAASPSPTPTPTISVLGCYSHNNPPMN